MHIYGGKFSNHQKAHILAESPLIKTYKNVWLQFEKMFCLQHKTTQHSPPKLKATFSKLTTYLEKERANEIVLGCKSGYSVPDAMMKGMSEILKEKSKGTELTDLDTDSKWAALADKAEVKDGKDLDVD
ncbi:hypothetical protein DXG01_015420 [Tephrocybe rancida]|nr:hypothetical protein DXG01_015420 [Tephrocybe rancida]